MKSIIQFLKIIFLIGAHGVAIAGVFLAVETASRGNVRAAPIAFGAMTGIIIFDLIAWWSFRDSDPARRHRIGNILYWGGCICGALLAVYGVFFVIVSGISHNPFWVFNAFWAAAVLGLPAFVCWKFGRAFRYTLSDP
jgi:hypothetical protein